MSKTIESAILKIANEGNLAVENIDMDFEPVDMGELEGANNKECFLNFVLGEVEGDANLIFYYNSMVKHNADYIKRNYRPVFKFNAGDIEAETHTVKSDGMEVYIPLAIDNVNHYAIGIETADGVVKAFKVFNGFIVKYDVCKHIADCETAKAKRGGKAKRLENLMECYGFQTIDELEEFIASKQ